MLLQYNPYFSISASPEGEGRGRMKLDEFFAAHPRFALGFSGGVDSSYLLHAATRAGADVAPYFVKTAFQPAFELADARRVAELSGAALRVVEMDILCEPKVVCNEADRCYHCKRAIFSRIAEAAAREGYDLLADGTNASDDAGDRPGMRALAELGVISPLRLCGLSKADVRRLSREAGLFTHDKPAYACLATRVATGEAITREKLHLIERAETFLTSLGFEDFRVRLSNGHARIELREAEMPRLLERRGEIVAHFEEIGAAGVALDLRPR